MSELVVAGAVVGPAVAGAAWLALVRVRSARWIAAGALGLAAHAAAWVVVGAAYRGDPLAWRGLAPGLLGGTVAVAAEIGILLVLLRADGLERGSAPAAVVGLAVSASAVVATAYAGSLTLVALFLPIPTLAGAVAGLGGPGRPELRGLLGLAAADAVALAGLSVVFARTDSALIGPIEGLGVLLLLGAAAAKAGAIPWVASWRLGTSRDPAWPIVAAQRGQGLALAVIAGLVMARGDLPEPVAAVAVLTVVLSGVAAVFAPDGPGAAAALCGAAAGVPLLALGLGGAVGARAFLLLFPVFLLAAGTVTLLTGAGPEPGRVGRGWRWVGAAAMGVAAGSLVGFPPGGGFPGTWLALSLGTARGGADARDLLLAGGTALGLTLAFLGAAGLLRTVRTTRAAAALGAVAAGVLLYVGTQPVRLGVGWWLRIEADLGVPGVLAVVGAPDLPAVDGPSLLLAAAPALVLIGLIVVLGGGLRDLRGALIPLVSPRPNPLTGRAGALAARARRIRLGFLAAVVVELSAIVMALRLLFLAARGGFL